MGGLAAEPTLKKTDCRVHHCHRQQRTTDQQFSQTHTGVLKKSVTEIVNFGDQVGLVCLRSQQAASE
jgi:hypothetical protein